MQAKAWLGCLLASTIVPVAGWAQTEETASCTSLTANLNHGLLSEQLWWSSQVDPGRRQAGRPGGAAWIGGSNIDAMTEAGVIALESCPGSSGEEPPEQQLVLPVEPVDDVEALFLIPIDAAPGRYCDPRSPAVFFGQMRVVDAPAIRSRGDVQLVGPTLSTRPLELPARCDPRGRPGIVPSAQDRDPEARERPPLVHTVSFAIVSSADIGAADGGVVVEEEDKGAWARVDVDIKRLVGASSLNVARRTRSPVSPSEQGDLVIELADPGAYRIVLRAWDVRTGRRSDEIEVSLDIAEFDRPSGCSHARPLDRSAPTEAPALVGLALAATLAFRRRRGPPH